MGRITCVLASLALASSAEPAPTLSVNVANDGSYNVFLDGALWYGSVPTTICSGGSNQIVQYIAQSAAQGYDSKFGAYSGTSIAWAAFGSSFNTTFKAFSSLPNVVTVTATFPFGWSTAGCGSNSEQSIAFPSFDIMQGVASTAAQVAWSGEVLSKMLIGAGLSGLSYGSLDAGPLLTFVNDTAGSGLVISTLDAHKVVIPRTTLSGGTPAPLTSLWSAERQDQIACLSQLCSTDQKPNGGYAVQRVEGYGLTAASARLDTETGLYGATLADGSTVQVAPLIFAYSQQYDDNWVGTNSTGPDGSYGFTGENGYILTAPTTPGTVPLQVWLKTYNATHHDYAAVASAEGLAWAQSNGYTFQYTAGYVWSSPPNMTSSGSVSWGLCAAIPSIPSDWSYSILLVGSYGGPTAAMYAWGEVIQKYKATTRLPSVTLSDVGYYTDDGAYYYVWEAFGIPFRSIAGIENCSAQVGLLKVKEQLYSQGVPVAYMQLDDWWYQGPFYFGNVKSVVNWTASTVPRLFPDGLPAFSDALGLPLQLYTPFWADAYVTPYNMTESTVFSRTKLVTPADSYAFFSDLFDNGLEQTNGRMQAYEIDFLDSNFAGSSSMFETVHSADQWYAGMAQAAAERGVIIQYCLPSATDMLVALDLPAVVQARASPDYVNTVDNAADFAGSSLLMGAVRIAPSKDTLWTRTTQPPTYSDTMQKGDYTTQPHVQLDVILATLSLGPVGISDGYNQTDTSLISQSFLSSTNSTLLRPSRPVSWVDAVFFNKTLACAQGSSSCQWNDVRSTHAEVPFVPATPSAGSPASVVSHYVVAWRTASDTTLGPWDLYPAPQATAVLGMRQHVLEPAGAAQWAGCVDGQPAVPSCISLTPPGGIGATIPATGTGLANVTLTVLYEPLPNGAYFLGELNKLVHVSPQRFAFIGLAGAGPAGVRAGLFGTPGSSVSIAAVDPSGTVRIAVVSIPAAGYAEADL